MAIDRQPCDFVIFEWCLQSAALLGGLGGAERTRARRVAERAGGVGWSQRVARRLVQRVPRLGVAGQQRLQPLPQFRLIGTDPRQVVGSLGRVLNRVSGNTEIEFVHVFCTPVAPLAELAGPSRSAGETFPDYFFNSSASQPRA